MADETRILRVPLTVDLIQRMDNLLIQGVAGYETRADLVREAIEAMVMELSYEAAPPEPGASASRTKTSTKNGGISRAEPDANIPPSRTTIDENFTRLQLPEDFVLIDEQTAQIVDHPLFGLHNRDYPSLWAATLLAQTTQTSLVSWERFLTCAVDAAWSMGQHLSALESTTDQKLSGIFPTNRIKPQSAEDGFKNSAIGYCKNGGNELVCSGPLFQWRICQVRRRHGEIEIGITALGRDLLRSLKGFSVHMPHNPDHAASFFNYLKLHAPADYECFESLLKSVGENARRFDVIELFRSRYPGWTEAQAATNVAGYVSRAREWGLLESKQRKGLYTLTVFGKEILN